VGLDSEYDASDRLRERLEVADPALAARLEFDPTANDIWVRAAERRDLEAVARIAAAQPVSDVS
jgi:hypothetical protein